MARKKTTALAKYDEQLAKQAEAAAAQEAHVGGGQFFSLRGGTLKFNDAPVPNNEMAVVILDAVIENNYFTEDFDPESPSPPSCYAFGREEPDMKPHEEAPEPQEKSCGECEHNKWGTADRGRGKACRNRRRLALISAGTLDKHGDFEQADLGDIETAEVAYLALPPTSIRSFASYVKQVAGALKRPPHAVFTKVKLVDDEKTQFKVTFELLGPVPNDLLGAVMQRNETERDAIMFPYVPVEDEPKPKRGRAKKKKAAKKKQRKY